MAGRRKDIMGVRELLRHIRMTESDRAVARATGAHRKTVLHYRHWAQAHHLLEGVLPPIEDLQALLVQTGTLCRLLYSSVAPRMSKVAGTGGGVTVIAEANWRRAREWVRYNGLLVL